MTTPTRNRTGRAGRWTGAAALAGALAVWAATPAQAALPVAAPPVAAPSTAAPSTAAASVAAPVLAADSGCGLSFFKQQYTVCGPRLHYVVVYYLDGLDKSSYTQAVCWGPGTYGLFGLVPPGGLANAVADMGPCGTPSGPPPFPPS